MSKQKMTDEQIIETINLYNSGLCCREISEIYNITSHYIWRNIKKRGCKIRSNLEIFSRITEEETIKCIELYNTGKSTKSVSIILGIPLESVKRVVNSHNIMRKKTPVCYKYDEKFFDNIDTEAKSYFFGLLFADGNNNIKRNIIVIGLIDLDIDILLKFTNVINSNRPLVIRKLNDKNINHKNQYIMTIYSKHMCEVLNSYGLVPAKSLIKKFPQIILDSNEDIIRHFIRGYFDGNGGIYITNKNKTFQITSTYDMCNNIGNIFKFILGITRYRIAKHSNVFNLLITNKMDIIKIKNWMYENSNFHIKRKYDTFQKLQNGDN